MQKLLTIAFLLLSFQLTASEYADTVTEIERSWAKTYYSTDKAQQHYQYSQLLDRINQLNSTYPDHAELLIWQAITLATRAEQENSFSALSSIHRAQDLLIKAISINPKAMDGSAFVTLGSLYSLVPGWPIAFGNDQKAEHSLKKALSINPQGIDSNYFYGEFLLSHNQPTKASHFFTKAINAPVRETQKFADNQLKNEARLGLANANARKISGKKGFFADLFNSAVHAEVTQ
jgi:tetratricopeptide (TPR) repeat protein